MWGKDKLQAALRRLDRLKIDEDLATSARILGKVMASNETEKIKRLFFPSHLSVVA